MSLARQVPLFDSNASPQSWNQHMASGEYAVHYSSFEKDTAQPYCTVFPDLTSAEAHAQQQVQQRPSLRCRIYDHQGFVGAPIREIRGTQFKGEHDLTPRIRRWLGSIFFFGGLILIGFDWSTDFRLSWPGLIGSRLIIPGLLLLFTEAMIALYAKRASRDTAGGHSR